MTKKRAVIFAEGEFNGRFSKTGRGIIKYGSYDILAVIDSTLLGRFVPEFMPVTKEIPFVSSLREVIDKKPEIFIIGIAPQGGLLPESWREAIIEAMSNNMDIYNGLHMFFSLDKQFSECAHKYGVRIWDSRIAPKNLPVACGRVLELHGKRVLTVGTDCAIGKMSATYELHFEAMKRNLKSVFIPTGQTAIMNEGWGVSVDAVPGDFMAGACEKMIVEKGRNAEVIFIEGQGSLSHLGYSTSSLALLHGTLPTHLVLCHDPSRKVIKDTNFPMPTIEKTIELNESITPSFRKAHVCGICLNTSSMKEEEARKLIADYEKQHKLPVTDPMRFGVKNILEAII